MNFYNDENLFEASPKPKYKYHSIYEIQKYFPELPIVDIWCNPKMFSLKIATYDQAENMLNDGRISQEYWEGFCAIWRNLTCHYSSLAASFEIQGEK